MANSKKEAKELSCLFGFLIQDYQKSKLAKCETSKNQKWRNANAPLVKYLPKLFLLLDSLNEYSVCQKHYNNIIIKNFFFEKLEKFGNSKNGLPNNNANFCNFGIQVALPNFESESFVKKINEVKNLNKQLLLENEKLKKILGNKFDNQQERVEAILSKQNLVLVHNENESCLENEKLFKCTIAIDIICRIRHQKYVFAINLVLLAIKYSIAKSKTIIDIDSHLITAGGYTNSLNQIQKFENPWLYQTLNTAQIQGFISDEPISQKSINIPEILVPDPLSINPNSIDNIRKILDHIQEISGISKGTQKWIVVVCDRVPYNYTQKFKNNYPGIIL
ncbi:hypothetical protein C2G38_2197538 [Gigaspora rosea]|uniref:Uncharacterized protein n=1 Tax=Gigaspora rosea TaxID=44941 RepID=A0A397V2M6_9GLOM|nr:hypothetical protein C2G38_2197538 [Gigaspora rosea]